MPNPKIKSNKQLLSKSIYRVDQAVLNHFKNVISPKVVKNDTEEVVPIRWASGEKWAQIKNKEMLRDSNDSLILPIISIYNAGITDDPQYNTLGALPSTERLILGTEIIKDDSGKGLEYMCTYIDYPKQVTMNYEINIWSQYIKQMNEIAEQIIRKQEYQKSFVVFDQEIKGFRYYALIDNPQWISNDNMREIGQEERIIQKMFSFRITTPLIDKNSIKQERVTVRTRITEGVM